MDVIPFTLLIGDDCPCSYLKHVRGVTRVAKVAAEEFNSNYAEGSRFRLDMDTVVAGALLHDIGKLREYERTPEGRFVKSRFGKCLRHPFSGAAIALAHGLSPEIAHVIAVHAAEGDGTLRSPEAVVVNKADFINFETVKSFLGKK
jgi:putative nucleotidyltransferase with HDIG domain